MAIVTQREFVIKNSNENEDPKSITRTHCNCIADL